MKKTKIISIILALLMIFSLSITVFATEGNEGRDYAKVALHKDCEGTYKFYRVLEAKFIGEPNADNDYKVVYYFENNVWDFFSTGAGKSYISSTASDDSTAVIKKGDTVADDQVFYLNIPKDEPGTQNFAQLLKTYFEGKSATFSLDNDPDTKERLSEHNAVAGYYFVDNGTGWYVNLFTNNNNVTNVITPKNEKPTITKTVARLENNQPAGKFIEHEQVEYGDVVRFRIEIPVVKGAENYIIYDRYEIEKFKDLHEYSLYYIDKNDDEIEMDKTNEYECMQTTFGVGFKGAKWRIKTFDYSQAKAFVAYIDLKPLGFVPENGYQNKAYATYGSDELKTNEDDAWVHGSGIRIIKTAVDETDEESGEEKTNTRLGNAVFVLTDGNEDKTERKYAKFNTTDNVIEWVDDVDKADKYVTSATDTPMTDYPELSAIGKVNIKGLRYGKTYYLEEIVAPKGFKLADDLFEVTISGQGFENRIKYPYKAPNGYVMPKTIKNAPDDSVSLPETGGIGTAVFYALGSLMAVGALVVLVTNKRVRN